MELQWCLKRPANGRQNQLLLQNDCRISDYKHIFLNQNYTLTAFMR